MRLLGPDGRLDPSHAFLAKLAAVSEDTVQRALDRLRGLGLLFWQRRLVRDETTGWRCEQTSNAYALTPTTTVSACDPQLAGAVEISLRKKEACKQTPTASAVQMAAQSALAAIAARRIGQLWGVR